MDSRYRSSPHPMVTIRIRRGWVTSRCCSIPTLMTPSRIQNEVPAFSSIRGCLTRTPTAMRSAEAGSQLRHSPEIVPGAVTSPSWIPTDMRFTSWGRSAEREVHSSARTLMQRVLSRASPSRSSLTFAAASKLRTFFHLKDLVSQETMRLAVDFFSRFLIRCVHQTEDLALAFIQPIPEVFHPVLSLNLEILHMGVGDIFSFRP